MLALVNLREELILAVLPYQADDLAERERVVAAAERMAAWVIERGGHVNPNLPRYARVPLLVLEGRWREAREILEQPDASDFAFLARVRPFYLGTLARAQGDAETAWRCVHEPSPVRPASEPGEEIGPLPVQFQRLAAGLALDAGDLPAARGWLDLHRRWLDFMDATLGRAEGEVLEAEWHRAAGDPDRARDHAAASAGARDHPAAAARPARRASHARHPRYRRGRPSRRRTSSPQALALADACRAPYERALTLIAHAELARGDQRAPPGTRRCSTKPARSASPWTRCPPSRGSSGSPHGSTARPTGSARWTDRRARSRCCGSWPPG